MATKVLDRLTVAASPPALGGVLPLTFFDVPWLFTGPVERVFFYPYPHPVEQFTAHLLPSLVFSLSAALHSFYPLLGRVRPCPDGGGGYEFCSSGGDAGGVELTVAESDDDFEELSGGGPRDVARLYALLPQLPRTEDGTFSLAAAQVTVFAGRGLAVGVSIHHVACDDSSYMNFVKTWAGQCRVAAGEDAAAVPPPPFLDRGVVADPEGLAGRTLDEMRQLASNGPPPPPPPGPPPKLVIASFALTHDCIDGLKQRVVAKGAASENGCGRVHCSAFTVACAFAWACLARVDGSCTGKKRAHLLFSVECRRRLAPPIPQEYLGNCLRPCFVEVDMGLLGADGVLTAAAAIGASIKGLDDGVLDGADGWLHKILSLVPERPMSVGGSPRYGVYDTDFGLGRPSKVELVSIDKTPGTVSLAEGRDAQAGIEIGVVLPEAEMVQFSSCFSDGLKQQ
ncbi:malonyl-coenzyme A:anthocyanin 3-O-glucoside-6''-O-malonyltransferase-like [Phragmites australis]|uniref:malonyl-coenzyme A:anthocyanin 3-O-glucoside-6''-O-malonyltransferase-like n=1 Tax=Phragmites australis TaxID=29695 RepID=UPI002D785A01|nr:malonyl-coenzyme A:anthocyanin 3-O-glucoside-6''-O-malonyltransferase-like [Phragmites australis]